MVEQWVKSILIGVGLIFAGGLGLAMVNYIFTGSNSQWLPYTFIGIGFAIIGVAIYQKVR